MEVRLKQLDITVNQCFGPYINSEVNDYYINYYKNRINRRINQINTLTRLLEDPINDYEFYNLAREVYEIKYENGSYLSTNILLDTGYDNLTIKLKVNSKKALPSNYIFSYEELLKYFKIGNVLLDGVYVVDNAKVFDGFDYIKCDDQGLADYLGKFKKFNSIISRTNIDELKKVLTRDRIRKDLINLVKYTIIEINYLINVLNSNKLTRV